VFVSTTAITITQYYVTTSTVTVTTTG
jgi:hypothetical protein